MSSKKKGSRIERELFHLFHSTGSHIAVRAAGSGSTPKPAPDLLVGGKGRVLAIECKSGKGKRRDIKKQQIDELKEFSKLFGAEPWIAARFDNMPWYFLKINQLGKSKGSNYFINPKMAISKGIRFEEIIGKYKQRRLD